jgi:hypothetical protein
MLYPIAFLLGWLCSVPMFLYLEKEKEPEIVHNSVVCVTHMPIAALLVTDTLIKCSNDKYYRYVPQHKLGVKK